MNVLLKAHEDEEEGNGTPRARDRNDDDSDEFDLRDVFDDPNDDGIAKAIAEAEEEAQGERRDQDAQAVADQYMAEAMNIPSSELSVGSLTESAKNVRRGRHVSKKLYTFCCCIQSETF